MFAVPKVILKLGILKFSEFRKFMFVLYVVDAYNIEAVGEWEYRSVY